MTTTNYLTGQKVRYVSTNPGAGVIAYGSIGTVQGINEVLVGCPIVYFPKGTHGPHDTFTITRPATDLEPVL